MIPLRGSPLRRNRAPVNTVVIAINVAVFLFQSFLGPRALSAFIETFALVPARFFEGEARSWFEYFPFVTNMFLHGGLLHLVSNMWTLWIFGPPVEDRIGPGRYLMFYLLTGLAASWTHALFNAGSNIPTLGASGAISGVMGCYVRLFPRSRILMMLPIPFLPLFLPLPAVIYAGFWLTSQIVPALFELLYPRNTGGVAWWAHIGGFLAGWYLIPFFNRRKRQRTLFVDDDQDWMVPYRRYDRV